MKNIEDIIQSVNPLKEIMLSPDFHFAYCSPEQQLEIIKKSDLNEIVIEDYLSIYLFNLIRLTGLILEKKVLDEIIEKTNFSLMGKKNNENLLDLFSFIGEKNLSNIDYKKLLYNIKISKNTKENKKFSHSYDFHILFKMYRKKFKDFKEMQQYFSMEELLEIDSLRYKNDEYKSNSNSNNFNGFIESKNIRDIEKDFIEYINFYKKSLYEKETIESQIQANTNTNKNNKIFKV